MGEGNTNGVDGGVSNFAIGAPNPPLAPTVGAVSIKLPPFYSSDPELWFTQVEAQNNTRSITQQDTKFWYVAAALSQDTAQEVRDVLQKPPAVDPYEHLKKKLIERTASTARERLQKLLSAETLGDCRPSQLLRRMQQLAGSSLTTGTIDNNLLRQLFLQRLPTNVQQMLVAVNANTLDEEASMADRMMELPFMQVNAIDVPTQYPVSVLSPQVPVISPQVPVTSPQVHNVAGSDSAALFAAVTNLTREISDLKVQVSKLAKNCSRGRSQSRVSHKDTKKDVCFYHNRFGASADKCTKPCKFASEN